MPKISLHGGPSSVDAEPGDVIEDGNGRVSALHAEEQNALTVRGERDDDAWLDEEDGDSSPGNSYSPSSEKQTKNDDSNEKPDQLPARTTGNRSKPAGKQEPSTASSTGSSGADSQTSK